MGANHGKRRLVSVAEFLEKGGGDLRMELLAGADGLKQHIAELAINRPGLALAGFFRYFAARRIQVIGLAEHSYLASLAPAERIARIKAFLSRRVPCVVLTRNLRVFPELLALTAGAGVPLLRSRMVTKNFVNAATIFMENLSALRARVQGTMVEIMGLGVLIEGPAGLGKSETALGLIRRGCALISDDITEMRLDSAGHVIAAPVDVTRYHMEIRGLGIIHIPSLFGVASVREEKRLDLVATLQVPPRGEDAADRGGDARTTRELLGVKVPQVLITVAPGRDIVNLIETAALDLKLRHLGHDAAKELDEKLVSLLTGGRVGSE